MYVDGVVELSCRIVLVGVYGQLQKEGGTNVKAQLISQFDPGMCLDVQGGSPSTLFACTHQTIRCSRV